MRSRRHLRSLLPATIALLWALVGLVFSPPAHAYSEWQKSQWLYAPLPVGHGVNGLYGAYDAQGQPRNPFTNPSTGNPVLAFPATPGFGAAQLQAYETPGISSDCVDVLPYMLPTDDAPLSPTGVGEAHGPVWTTEDGYTLELVYGSSNGLGYARRGYLYKVKYGLARAYEHYTWDDNWIYLMADFSNWKPDDLSLINYQFTGRYREGEPDYGGAVQYHRSACVGQVFNVPRHVVQPYAGRAFKLNAAFFMVNHYFKIWGGDLGSSPRETIELAVLQEPDYDDLEGKGGIKRTPVTFLDYRTYRSGDVAYFVKGVGMVAYEDVWVNHRRELSHPPYNDGDPATSVVYRTRSPRAPTNPDKTFNVWNGHGPSARPTFVPPASGDDAVAGRRPSNLDDERGPLQTSNGQVSTGSACGVCRRTAPAWDAAWCVFAGIGLALRRAIRRRSDRGAERGAPRFPQGVSTSSGPSLRSQ